MYLDAVIGGKELWGGVVPKIGRQFIQVVAVEGFPLESTPGILSALAELPSEYRWSSRFIFMDPHESLKHLDRFRKKWKQKIRGFFDQVFNTNTGSINQDAAAMVGDAEAAIAGVNSGLVAAGYYTSVVVLMDEDRERLASSALPGRRPSTGSPSRPASRRSTRSMPTWAACPATVSRTCAARSSTR